MHDFDQFAQEMGAQAIATLRAGEPALAGAVLDQIIAEAQAHPDFAPLAELAARIGAGVIAEYLGAKQLDDAEACWQSVRRLLGKSPVSSALPQAGQCAYNLIMGQLAAGRAREAIAVFHVLANWADQTPPSHALDQHLAEAGVRLVVVCLQLRPPSEVYDLYIPLRQAAQRHPDDLDISRSCAKSALFLTVAFARAGDPNFARSLASQVRTLVETAPEDPSMADIATKLERIYSA